MRGARELVWDFETDAAYQADLEWADDFVRREVEPLEFVIPHVLDASDPVRQELIPPLQDAVRARGLWATHLGPELGGQGHGQVKLGLLNEILGRSGLASIIFGCQAPDTGNAEILAHYGTEEHKKRYLQPLLDGQLFSTYSMTEPQAGSDPKEFTARAELDGDEWVINGEKWFSSNARWASFFIVMVITEPDNAPYQRHSMLIVPADAPGITIMRNVGIAGWDQPGEGGTPTSATRMCACPSRTCSATGAAPSRWRRPASAAGASITPCGRSAWPDGPSR
jgi:acyl-CoA dehydrogenase